MALITDYFAQLLFEEARLTESFSALEMLEQGCCEDARYIVSLCLGIEAGDWSVRDLWKIHDSVGKCSSCEGIFPLSHPCPARDGTRSRRSFAKRLRGEAGMDRDRVCVGCLPSTSPRMPGCVVDREETSSPRSWVGPLSCGDDTSLSRRSEECAPARKLRRISPSLRAAGGLSE